MSKITFIPAREWTDARYHKPSDSREVLGVVREDGEDCVYIVIWSRERQWIDACSLETVIESRRVIYWTELPKPPHKDASRPHHTKKPAGGQQSAEVES